MKQSHIFTKLRRKTQVVFCNRLVDLPRLLTWGTILWLNVIIIFPLISHPKKSFFEYNINNLGDYFAGFFSPLALIWLAYGIFIQGKEFKNVLKSFALQQKEFKKSVSVMEDQVIQIEIQQLRTWYNRNTEILSRYLRATNLNKFPELDTPFLIHKAFNIDNGPDFKSTFDEIKNIVELDRYIQKKLNEFSKNISLQTTIVHLKEEFHVLFGEDIKYSKIIFLRILILISVSSVMIKHEKKYKTYSVYVDWITRKEKLFLLRYIASYRNKYKEENIVKAFKNIERDTYILNDIKLIEGSIQNESF